VKRWTKNPSFDERRDKRAYVDSALWTYGCERFREYWGSETRAVPTNYRIDGDEGWYFPNLWVADFSALPALSRQLTTAIPKRLLRKIDAGGGFPDTTEFKRWDLPAGSTIIAQDATIHYPNGAIETWGQCRNRQAKQREAAE